MYKKIPNEVLIAPIKYSLIYLVGTFFLFMTSNLTDRVDNFLGLVFFVTFAYLFLYFGYYYGLKTKKNKFYNLIQNNAMKYKNAKILIIIGSIYFFVWGINQMIDFWGNDFSQIYNSLFDPGSSYKSKFEVYEKRLATGAINRITQGLLISSIFYSIFIPVLVFYWKCISNKLKIISFIAVFVYVLSFMSIGTQKGIGDVFLFVMAGAAILIGSGSFVLNKRIKRNVYLFSILFFLVIFAYMANNQSSRAQAFGLKSNALIGDVSGTFLAENFGMSVAYGVYTILAYPSHGYLGLSYNLKQDFEFSFGSGLSPAVESYRHQYLGGDRNFDLTYPVRTESATGWPAGMYWATAFPWFASDVSFVGCIFLMFFIGFMFSRVWINCISKHDFLSFAALGQFFIFIAFLPANNQVLMQRQGLWVVATILSLRIVQTLNPKKLKI